MLRIKLAAMLLRSTGASVKYIVRRRNNNTNGNGTAILAASTFKEARAKYLKVRVADTDTITITVEAVVAQRHETVFSTKENDNA